MRRLWTIIGVGDVASHQLGDAEAAEGAVGSRAVIFRRACHHRSS
jgi:hypothetical protein